MVLGLLYFAYFSTRNISLKAYYILLIFQQETSHLKPPVCTGGGGSSNGESWSSQGMLFCLFFIFVMNDVKWMHQKFNYLFGICLCYASSWCFPWKPILVFIFMLLLAPFKGFGNWYFKNNLYILLSANRRFKNSLYNIIFLSALLSGFRTKILFFSWVVIDIFVSNDYILSVSFYSLLEPSMKVRLRWNCHTFFFPLPAQIVFLIMSTKSLLMTYIKKWTLSCFHCCLFYISLMVRGIYISFYILKSKTGCCLFCRINLMIRMMMSSRQPHLK